MSDDAGSRYKNDKLVFVSNRCSTAVAGGLATKSPARPGGRRAASHGFFASGALRYFSIGISKYISSVPPASRTPVR